MDSKSAFLFPCLADETGCNCAFSCVTKNHNVVCTKYCVLFMIMLQWEDGVEPNRPNLRRGISQWFI